MPQASDKSSFKDTLLTVVNSGRCTECAACIISCPFKCLEIVNGNSALTAECHSCGICSTVCPRYDMQIEKLEQQVFERKATPEESFGIYREVVVAKSTDQRILEVCQDGGVVSAFLIYGLNSGRLDGAAVSGMDEKRPFLPVPTLAIGESEVIKCAGTKYTYSPNLIALQRGIEQKKKRLALVGTSCQIQAARRLQILPRYREKMDLLIGLLCSETFSYEGLMKNFISDQSGIDLRQIKKMNIKGKFVLTMKSGESREISLKQVKKYVRTSCNACNDFSARLADVSVGGLGLDGWSLVILRTEKGCELFDEANRNGLLKVRPISEEKNSLDMLIKISKMRMLRGTA